MAMIWSSRERNRSCSPLARRSRGRIQTSVRSNRPHQRVRVCDSKESPDPILQEKPVTGHEFRQNETPEFAALPLKNRGILKFSQSTDSRNHSFATRSAQDNARVAIKIRQPAHAPTIVPFIRMY